MSHLNTSGERTVEGPKAFSSPREIIEHFQGRIMDIILALPEDGMYGTAAVNSAVRREVLDMVNAAYAQGCEKASTDLQSVGVMYDQRQKVSD